MMNTESYAYVDGDEKRRFSGRSRRERKPWSILEIGAMVAGFMLFWPLGLVALYLRYRKGEMWKGASDMQGPWTSWKTPRDAADYVANTCASWRRGGWQSRNWQDNGAGFSSGYTSSGNQAFDDYRKSKLEELEGLRRKLDEERNEFSAFLNKLRQAKDKDDFERFMAERDAPKSQG